MKISKMIWTLATVLALTPVVSTAQQFAHLARDAKLRAGPSTDYPVVAELPVGLSVWVDGCINGYRWCDVTVGPERGWVYAGNIFYPYQGGRVPLLNYGAVIGIGIIAFSVGDYWDNHYRTRPWYPQRQHWINRPPPVLRPDVGHAPPLPPRNRPTGVDQTPPRVVPADRAQHPVQRPELGQAPKRKPRPPQGQPTKENQRPAQGQRGSDKRPPWDERQGGSRN